ncbi:VOC family protein [Enterovibrio makurazakiensis]|uniref:VOC family protein n=1 Tax=Enterovibrio gelatinilyticus TaxID=2899819 RepID=A0ABT5QYY6_9GAMM|nr:VOC family protein [Enterovibrio sp. ZSDZ42]MDD1793219.1 VOC family protein [Enterovibrio sp. ZSDZ42]
MIEFQSMFPVIVTAELDALKTFYLSTFGFDAVYYDPTFYLHLVSPSTGIQLGFLMPNHPSQPDFLHTNMVTDGYVISLEVRDAAKAFADAKAMNLNIAMELKEEVWGQIHFMVEDPAGTRIDIVEHVASPK